MNVAKQLAALAVTAMGLAAPTAFPQAPGGTTSHVFHLTNAGSQADQNEVMSALRTSMEPEVRLFLVPGDNAIVMRGTPAQIAEAGALLHEVERGHTSYRVTYTFTELEAGRAVSAQHYAMPMVAGQRGLLKQGSRIPIATTDPGKGVAQVTYVDVGLNFDATLDQVEGGTRLRSKLERTSLAEDKGTYGNPVIRQTLLEGTTYTVPGKPARLGSIDIPGSTRRLDVTVTVDPAP